MTTTPGEKSDQTGEVKTVNKLVRLRQKQAELKLSFPYNMCAVTMKANLVYMSRKGPDVG